MATRLKKHIHVLKVLCEAHPSVVKTILQGANKDLTLCLGECAHNVLRGNIPLSPAQKSRLTRYKKELRQIARKTTSQKLRKQVLQRGGFLGALLGPLLASLAGSVISGVVSSFKKK